MVLNSGPRDSLSCRSRMVTCFYCLSRVYCLCVLYSIWRVESQHFFHIISLYTLISVHECKYITFPEAACGPESVFTKMTKKATAYTFILFIELLSMNRDVCFSIVDFYLSTHLGLCNLSVWFWEVLFGAHTNITLIERPVALHSWQIWSQSCIHHTLLIWANLTSVER